MLAYDVSSDAVDEYLRVSATSASHYLKHFCRAIYELFGDEYLRHPTPEDVARITTENAQRGFPRMLGSIDCMHWEWKNCPCAWAGQYQSGHQKRPTIILQAIASKNLWIWHAFFGQPGCNNDINVLERSNVFMNVARGENTPVRFQVNGNEYNIGYYLADGIYPSWATFVKSISRPLSAKHRNFAQYQEAARKDVERAFGVLQARWHIIKGSARLWDPIDLNYIMKACIILHNMIVEDEGDDVVRDVDFPSRNDEPVEHVQPSRDPNEEFQAFLARRVGIRSSETHHRLKEDLIEHIWNHHENFGA